MKKYLLAVVSCLFLLPLIANAQEKNLEYFLQQAKSNSPLIKDFQNQISILKLDSAKIKAGLMPQVSGSSNLLYAPVISGFGYDPAITNGQLVSALVSVSKEITSKNRINTLIKNTQINRDSLGVQQAFSIQDIERNIATQYITTWGDQELLNLSKETLQLLKKQDSLLKKLTQASVFKQTEYLAFKVNLEQQDLAVLQNQSQYKNDFYTLSYLSGIADTATYTLASVPFQQTSTPTFEESNLSKKYAIDSLRNLNNLDQLQLNYKPKLNVFADAGYNSSLTPKAYKNFGWSVGLNLNIPIYDGGQKKLSTQQIVLNQLTQNNYKYYYSIQYQKQQAQIKQMIAQYETFINKANTQLSYSKTLIDANALQLSTGDVRMTDYLLSISNYLNLRAAIIQNKTNQLQMTNQLHYFTVK
jgi:outer membrane protein TolC